MKRISAFLFVAGAIALTASCAKEINVDNVIEQSAKEINITVIASEKPAVVSDTKTFIDGSVVKWSSSNEKIKVFEVATPVDTEKPVETAEATSAAGVTEDGGSTMKFSVTMTAKEEPTAYSAYDYYAVYPSSAYHKGSTTNVASIAIDTKAAQTPTASNFDPSADLLIAKKVENGGSQATNLDMEFARLVAVGKMTVKNLETTDPITKITFSVKEGTGSSATPVVLAGRTAFNLETARPVSEFGSNVSDNEIILDYTGQNISANTSSGMVAYFFCYPFAINSSNPGSFKVVVETATEKFTKEVNVNSTKGLAFVTGKSSAFSVDMDNIDGETKAVDLRYAYLDYDDYSSAGGASAYANLSVTKTHGDVWGSYACATSGGIGIRKNNSNNDSYIKLPDFEKTIKTVVVTLKSIPSGQAPTITLETTATGKGGDIASIATTESTLQYTFDLTSFSYNTAYLRANTYQALVSKIEVYAGDDNRTSVGAPSDVTAALNTTSNSSIDVSWTASSDERVGGYQITLAPVSGNTVIATVASNVTSYTAEGLTPSTEYLIAVCSIPTDPYLYKESADIDATPDSVTTGAPSVVYSLFTGSLVEGDYVIYYSGKAMKNTVASSRLQYSEVSPVNNKITDPDASIVWHIAPSGSYWTIYNAAVNKYAAATSSNNQAQLLSDGSDDKALWTVSEQYDFINKDRASVDNKYLRNNGTYGFACYKNSTGGALSLYKLEDNTDYTISCNSNNNSYGTVSSNVATAKVGTTITLTIAPADGYKLTSITATDASSNTVTLSTVDATHRTFTMPASNVTVSASFDVNESKAWHLVTDASSLSEDDLLVLVCESTNAAAGNISSQIMASVSVSISSHTISSLPSEVVQLTLGGSSDAWTFANGSGELLGATAAKKLAWDNGTTTWSISITDGNATITNGSSSYGTMQYNSGSPRFTTYTSGQTAIQLYRYE